MLWALNSPEFHRNPRVCMDGELKLELCVRDLLDICLIDCHNFFMEGVENFVVGPRVQYTICPFCTYLEARGSKLEIRTREDNMISISCILIATLTA